MERKPRTDKDHLLWTEAHWSSTPDARALRTIPSLIVELDRDDHEAKHHETPPVPLLGHYAIRRTLNTYEPGSNPIESLDNLMLAIEQAANSPKAHIIEKHLAELAIWALDLQHPFVALSPQMRTSSIIDLGEHRR